MKVRATISTKWGKGGVKPVDVDNVEAYSVDSAMDTDTDNWTISVGDVDRDLVDVLKRDNEVRVNIFGFGNGKIESLHSGFTDEIVMDETGLLTFSGRDMTAPAVDSQHPPQIWHAIRPEVLVAREARALKIGSRVNLAKAPGFKTYGTDGSETYWQVWYRFYRKRRMWMWAEPDGQLIAAQLNYKQRISYYFGEAEARHGSNNPAPSQWIPVERVEWRSNKQQRVGEVYFFGHRGDVGFVAHATDPSTRSWIKRPTKIFTSGDVHNFAEARAEAWEEVFESKVGATEIKIMVEDQGYLIRQGTMARINIPSIGLRGDFYVVGTHIVGSVTEGLFQEVRLREKNYAISRRVPTDPQLSEGPTNPDSQGNIDKELTAAGIRWANYFIEATMKFRGPWPFDLFLGVLLAICDKETGFHNERKGQSGVDYPDTPDNKIPYKGTSDTTAYRKFREEFANESQFGIVNQDYAVGPMQLLTLGYKLYADSIGPAPGAKGDEVYGGRWDPRANILASGAVLNGKLNGGFVITPNGSIHTVTPSGPSLQPTEANIWQGVAAYGEGAAYAADVRQRYNDTYKAIAEDASKASRQDTKAQAAMGITGSSAELRKRVLNNFFITFTRASQKTDIQQGLIHDEVLKFMLAFTEAEFPIVVSSLRSDHDVNTDEGRVSAHSKGLAVDMSNYNLTSIGQSTKAMKWIGANQEALGFSQLIGPIPSLVIPNTPGYYDTKTLNDHHSHIHVGYPLSLAN